MGDKNSLVRATTTTAVKSGHGILKALYVDTPGDAIFSIANGLTHTYASATVLVGCVIACDTVTVNGLTYTAVSGLKCGNTEFSICGAASCVATDLAASITCDARTGTVVSSIDQTAAACAATVTITASTYGILANQITLSTSGATLTPSGTNLENGDGDQLFVIDLDSATSGHMFTAPYINHPVSRGLHILRVSGTTGSIVAVYE